MSQRSSNPYGDPRLGYHTNDSSLAAGGQTHGSSDPPFIFQGMNIDSGRSLGDGSVYDAGGGTSSRIQHQPMGPPGSSHYLQPQNISMDLYFRAEGPWNPQFGRLASKHAGIPLPSTSGFHESGYFIAQNRIAPTLSASDSGYGTEARKSVGVPSVYGDNDTSSFALNPRFFGYTQLEQGSVYSAAQDSEVDGSTVSWDQVSRSNATAYSSPDALRFQCENCERSFQKQSELKKHVKITHVKPYRCEEVGCEKRFGTTSDVARHQRAVHKVAGTTYVCRHCTKTDKQAKKWTRADNFRNHLKNSHKIEIPTSDLQSYIIPDEPVTKGTTSELTPQMLNVTVSSYVWPALPQQSPLSQYNPGEVTGTNGTRAPPPTPRPDTTGPGWNNLTVDLNLGRQTVASASSIMGHDTPTQHSFVVAQTVYDGYDFGWMSEDANNQHFNDSMTMSHDMDDDMEEHTPCSASDILTGLETDFVQAHQLNALDPSLHNPGLAAVMAHAMDSHIEVDNSGDGVLDDSPEQDHDDIDLDQDAVSISMAVTGQIGEHISPWSRDASPVAETVIQDTRDESLPSETLPNPINDDSDTAHCLDDAARTGLTPPRTESGSLLLRPALNMEGMDTTQVAEMVRGLLTKLDGKDREEVLRSLAFEERSAVREKPKKPASTFKPKADCNVKCTYPDCDKVFQLPSQMKKHLKRHEKPYSCTRCDYRLGSKSDWKRHENNMHGQYELWKCDEIVEDAACPKVYHCKEAFVHHLRTQHEIDGTKLEDKLVRCCVREGDPRFWCGFCVRIIDTKKQGAEASKARFNHIDDHYQGRNGLPVKNPEDWFRDGNESRLPDLGVGSSAATPLKKAATQSRKRTRDGTESGLKRVKMGSQNSATTLWECCQCDQSLMSYANNPSCIECGRQRCSDCAIHNVALNEHV